VDKTVVRDENGRFKKGSSGNPGGRAKKQREVRFMEITLASCSFDDWKYIVKTAVEQARSGDHQARKWLSDYLLGPPPQRHEVGGIDGEPIGHHITGGIRIFEYGSETDGGS
jgi:hypothetical protein